MIGIRTALEDIANVDLSNFTDEDIVANLPLIQKAAEGNVEAIDELIHILAIDFVNSLSASEEYVNALNAAINGIDFNTLEIGDHLATPFLEALKTMVLAGQIAADEINKALENIQYSPIIEYKTVTATNYAHAEGAANGTIQYQDENGNIVTMQVLHNDAYNDIQGATEVKIPVIKSGKNAGQVATAENAASALSASVFTGGTGKYTSATNRGKGASKGSGGGSKQKTKEKDVTRYHEINAKLEQMSAELEKINTIKDRA